MTQKPDLQTRNNITVTDSDVRCKKKDDDDTHSFNPNFFIASFTVKLLLVFSMDFVTNSANLRETKGLRNQSEEGNEITFVPDQAHRSL